MMASGLDVMSKASDGLRPPVPYAPRRAPSRQSPASWRPRLLVLVVLVAAGCFAFFRAPGWTGEPLLTSIPGLYDPHRLVGIAGGGHNAWADESLPPGDWPDDRYLLGVGKADITGPVVELNLMGYANFAQVGSGLRQRLYSRAFIVGDLHKPADRFVYLVLDIQSGDTAIRYGILRGLRSLGPRYAMYGSDNVAVTATHSHSGPGAWLNYLLPQITSKGFDTQSYRAIVEGCILSIRGAHESLAPGSLSLGTTKIIKAGINRSLFSYLANPAEERARYNISADDDGSVEREMSLLKFRRDADGKNIGVLTWFPTHGTSMRANNTLISGDNKGVAADLFEKTVRGGPDEADDLVAGFSQANMGDVSPNVLGAFCEGAPDHDQVCRLEDSACSDGRSARCRARGPAFSENDHGASSCLEIGRRQLEGALEIYEALKREPARIRGRGVKAFHEYHDMSNFRFALPNGSVVRTCPAALGWSFAAGTWDEPSILDLSQHILTRTRSSPLLKLISWLFKNPSRAQVECQQPKNILLDVGEVSKPYEWTPNVVDVQTLRVGQLLLIISPAEVTTMAGRRWKAAVARRSGEALADELDGEEPIVLLGGPSNSYTHYVTTEQEYGIQRYEGASTLYGRHTLDAYIDRSLASIAYLRARGAPERARVGPEALPPDNSNVSLSFIPGVLYDRPRRSKRFGAVMADVQGERFPRGAKVQATFAGANPRNNLRLEQTYAAVERRGVSAAGAARWERVRDDSDWNLTFHWRRSSLLLGTSEVDIAWQIERSTPAGEYRLRYYGDYKTITGRIEGFAGRSRVFRVG